MDQNNQSDRRQRLIEEARLLVGRLERISADSVWAHRSSGLRGSLLRSMDGIEADPAREDSPAGPEGDWEHLESQVAWGYEMLVKAAREIRK